MYLYFVLLYIIYHILIYVLYFKIRIYSKVNNLFWLLIKLFIVIAIFKNKEAFLKHYKHYNIKLYYEFINIYSKNQKWNLISHALDVQHTNSSNCFPRDDPVLIEYKFKKHLKRLHQTRSKKFMLNLYISLILKPLLWKLCFRLRSNNVSVIDFEFKLCNCRSSNILPKRGPT